MFALQAKPSTVEILEGIDKVCCAVLNSPKHILFKLCGLGSFLYLYLHAVWDEMLYIY